MKIVRNPDMTLTLYLDEVESCMLPLDVHEVLDVWKDEFDSDVDAPLAYLQFSQEVIKFLDKESKENEQCKR